MSNIATQLDHVMSAIWDGGRTLEPQPTIKALVSYVRSHANNRNVENVFEVIDILWGENIRALKQRNDMESHGGADYCVDVQFDDDSQILVECRNGIGHGLQLISVEPQS